MPAEVVAETSVSSSPSTKALPPPSSTRLEWMWHELPMSFSDGFAMNVAEMPLRKAISLTPFL